MKKFITKKLLNLLVLMKKFITKKLLNLLVLMKKSCTKKVVGFLKNSQLPIKTNFVKKLFMSKNFVQIYL